MATIQGIITSTGETVDIVIPTVRIPELPELGLPMEDGDSVAVYDASENRTRHQTLGNIRSFIQTGGASEPVPPVLQGSDVEIIASDDNIVGTNRVVSAVLINKNYSLHRVGYGQLLTSQFNILPSGGFELVGDRVRKGDIFFAHLFEMGATEPGSGGGVAAATSIITGIALISDDTPISGAHYNKLLHVSNNVKNINLILPEISSAPANLIIPIETTISNGYYCKVLTQSGQLIYWGETGKTKITLGSNEFIWLVRGVDGWYVMKSSDSMLRVGQPFFDVVERPGAAVARGQWTEREKYPRIIEMLEANPGLWVSEAEWQDTRINLSMDGGTDWFYPLRSMYSKGNGTTHFRFPDLRNLAFRGLKDLVGADPLRSPNISGAGQGDYLRRHNHVGENVSKTGFPDGSGDRQSNYYWISPPRDPAQAVPLTIGFTGAAETTVRNAGFIPLIQV